jgi:hypothetical protein
MRGIALINAVVLVAEVGDFTRFSNPRQLTAHFLMGHRPAGIDQKYINMLALQTGPGLNAAQCRNVSSINRLASTPDGS